MRILFVLFILTVNSLYSQKPEYKWAKSFGSSSDDNGYSIVTDSKGHIIICGSYEDSINFDNIKLTCNASGGDFFIAKLDSNGSVLWAKNGNVTHESEVNGIFCDKKDNIFVSGIFKGEMKLGNTTLKTTQNIVQANFYSKLDSDGNFIWSKQGGQTKNVSYLHRTAIAGDIQGNLFFTGIMESNGYSYIIKLDSNGNSLWQKNDLKYKVRDIAVDNNGSLITTGESKYLATKYDKNGNELWQKQFINLDGTNTVIQSGMSIAIDNNNIILTGAFKTLRIGIINENSIITKKKPGSGSDMYIIKLDSNGNVLWTKQVNNDIGTEDVYPYSIATDNNGFVFITGRFGGKANFESINAQSRGGPNDFYLLSYDSNGKQRYVDYSGSTAQEEGSAITNGGTGFIYVLGRYNFLINLGGSTLNSRSYDLFITKVSKSALSSIKENFRNQGINIYPNPFISSCRISFNGNSNFTGFKIVNLYGKIIRESTFHGEELILERGSLNKGLYFLILSNESGNSKVEKLVVE